MGEARKRVEALVNPDLLLWARKDAGIAPSDAAKRAQVAPERLASWERGDTRPSIAQLRRLAALYNRPLAVFFLPEPPKDFAALKDFRRLPGRGAGVLSPALRFAVRRARERRELALELYRGTQGEPPSFNLQVRMHDGPEHAGEEIRRFLKVGIDEQITWGAGYGAFNRWRAALEDHGVLVFQARNIDTADMRGFSMSDTPLPAVVLNIKDVPNARTFTMLHEVAHLALRQGGGL